MTRPTTQSLSRAQARRIALAAQGFLDPSHAVPTMRTLVRAVRRTGVLQVDAVNVLQRAHYMPLYSRMGPYDTGLLARAAEQRPRRLVEYWAHAQALMPVDLWPVMHHRMERMRALRGKWWRIDDDGLPDRVLAQVRERGASTARDLEEGERRSREHWGWNWSDARKALDYLYSCGDLAIAGRSTAFEPIYDLPERVLPGRVLETPVPTPDEAARELVRRAAASHGVATVVHLADYYRMRVPGPGGAAAAVRDLVEAGELEEVRVEGWRRPAYLHAGARRPRRVDAAALLSPFDPVVWERERTESLFDFHYRIEIYVPAAQRRHGYYVLPFLLGEALVGRVDLKADRSSRTLLVPAAYGEPGAPEATPERLAGELVRLARWLGLEQVRVGSRGDLSRPLSDCLRRVE